MKKLLFIFTALLLFSCSSSSDDNSSSNSNFNPPTWIQGKWTNTIGSGYKFTSNNVCSVSLGGDICYKEMLDNYNKVGATSTINESIITDTEYKFSYAVQGSTVYFHFIKKSNSEIQIVSQIQDLPNTPLFKQ